MHLDVLILFRDEEGRQVEEQHILVISTSQMVILLARATKQNTRII